MRIEADLKYNFSDVLIRPKRSQAPSRSAVDLVRRYTFLNSMSFWEGIPIISSNLDATGTLAIANVLSEFRAMTCLHKYYSVEQLVEFLNGPNGHYSFVTIGIKDDDLDKLNKVADKVAFTNICIDVANGHTQHFVDRVKLIREKYPNSIIMAGNVAIPEMTQELLISGGVDIVKVGIGQGSVCTTRLVTGCGYPQLSAIIECADVAHGLHGHICADGGCQTSGDVVKAFAAGADFVMLGGMFCGTLECEGEWEEGAELIPETNGGTTWTGNFVKKYLKSYGMSSKEANEKYNGGLGEYKAAEGKCVKVPYKGPVKETIQQILGGLRSACTYVGCDKLKDLSKCTTFIRCTDTHNRMFENNVSGS